MNEKLINPGYANPIIELEIRNTQFNSSEFANADVQDKGIDFSYQTDIYKEYSRLRLNLKYIRTTIDGNNELLLIDFFRGFKVGRVNQIEPKELLIVFEYCVDELNKELEFKSSQSKNFPTNLPSPSWEDCREILENIAQDLNGN